MPKNRPYGQLVLVFLLYLAIGIAATFPLILNLSTHLYGMPGDSYATLWSFWWNMTHPIEWAAPAQPTLLVAAKALSYLFNEVATYNILLLAGYPLAGLSIYLIVHYFTQDKSASFLAGMIYILGPYHIYQSYVHLSLAMIAWLPLYLYALLLWLKDPKTWRAIISGLLLGIVILDNYYYGYLAVLVTIFFVIGLLIQIYRKKMKFWTALYQGIIAAGVALILVVPFVLPSLSNGTTASFERPLRELFVFRAQWWDFFVPAITHPIVGNLIQSTTRYELAGSNYFERTLYLGYMPLLLAIIGIWRTKNSWLTYFLVSLLVVSIVIAVAPDWLAPTLHKWFPTFRVYSRFGLLSLTATSILAGIGIASLSKGVRSWMLHLAFALLVIADFYPLLPSPMIDVSQPKPVETALAQLPTGTTIVYPLVSGDEVRTPEYLSDLRHYRQPLFNAIDPASQDEKVRELLMYPDRQDTLTLLRKDYGIRYILIRKDIYREGRLPGNLAEFYDPSYPQYLPAWNGGNIPNFSKLVSVTQLYDDDQAALYEVN